MRTLICNATCVLPEGIHRTNVLLEGTRIASVDAPAGTAADELIDATGLHLLPGVIDDQVHFREPGLTHKEDIASGSRACAAGGVTTFLEMPNTSPPTVTPERLEEKLAIAARTSMVNYGFYIGATPANVEVLQSVTRTPGIKIFIGSSTGDLLVDEQAALEGIFAGTTLPICAHCEDEATVRANAKALGGGRGHADHSRIRDHAAAMLATRRAIALAHRHGHRFHVLHVSTAGELALIADHRGLITAEVCPHHLYFSTDDYERLGSLVQMNPSVKTTADAEALWRALAAGAIQVLATDHAPHLMDEKARPYPQSPSGVPAVENLLALTLDGVNRGLLSLERAVEALSDAPARVWDMVGKGRIAPGYDADLVLVDLAARRVVRNEDQVCRAGWTPWHGTELQGWPRRTFVMGRTVWCDGKFDDAVRGAEVQYDHARGGWWGTA